MSAEIVKKNGTPTAIETAAAANWTRERIDLIKRAIAPKGITDDEFALFVEQCKRSGLDPMLKEIFCVPRRKNVGTKDAPRWVTVHEAQPSEAGMLGRAERFGDFRGITAAAVYTKDKITIDAGTGQVSHSFSPVGDRGKLVGAWSRVVRDSKEPVLIWLDFDAYAQNTATWGKMPATMIEKCARYAALRKAYPHAYGGLYGKEELPEEPEVEVAATVAPPPPLSRAARAQLAASPAHPALPSASATNEPSPPIEPDAPPPEDAEIVEAPTDGISEFDKLAARINEAQTEQHLSALVEAVAARTAAEKDELRKLWGARRAQIRGGQ